MLRVPSSIQRSTTRTVKMVVLSLSCILYEVLTVLLKLPILFGGNGAIVPSFLCTVATHGYTTNEKHSSANPRHSGHVCILKFVGVQKYTHAVQILSTVATTSQRVNTWASYVGK